MKAVIYARYSSDSQREESIEGQLRECKEYAERNGITVLSTYIDRALSAKTDNRPDFQRMIKDSAKGLFDIVLVWKLDRFARNRYDSAHYKAILKKNGVKVVSAKEAIAEDSTGILLESLLEGYAEFYSVELSEKIHRGQKENALKGLNNGGGIPLGYVLGSDKRLAVDPLTAPVVLEIFTRYAEGETVRAIVESLNERGLQTRRNKPYSVNSFNAILKNRKYIGEYKYQDVVIPGGVPAIVPQELFNRVQARMEKNKRAPAMGKADENFLLTTKLFCGKCGRLMVGESGTSHTGKKHYYYKCGSAKRKTGCTKKAVKKGWIENLIVERTMQMIFDDMALEAIAGMVLDVQARENTSLPVLKEQLAQTEHGIQNMLNAIQQGIFTPSTKQRLEELEEAKERLTVSILQEELQKPCLSKEQVLFFLHRFRAIDTTKQEQRQRLIDSFVNAVYVYDDKIILTFNYQDGTETITLDDINGSDLEAGSPPKKNTPCGVFFFWYLREVRRLSVPAFQHNDFRICAQIAVFTYQQIFFVSREAIASAAALLAQLIAQINSVVIPYPDRLPTGQCVFQVDERASERIEVSDLRHSVHMQGIERRNKLFFKGFPAAFTFLTAGCDYALTTKRPAVG